ncbi:hypothetical protein GH714_028138 [Hevea brasiliensis]|uniref:FBD domain-containing protein n=1 Tax=Hevea brasiliensis TaxID=3981 RepID=A0A6A6N4G7_HEVBR|nr:hypothetical protein GH714_028138 [Hevea brasiliensis]
MLVNLHTCAGVYVDSGFASELYTLTHLRNLDVDNVCEDHASELFAAIFRLENLVCLSLSVENTYLGTSLPELESFTPPPHLQELTLHDEAYKAKIIGKEFREAGGYPELETLSITSRNPVEWTEIANGAFPNLKSLSLNFV